MTTGPSDDDTKTTKGTKDAKPDPRDLVLAALVGMLLSPLTGIVRALAFRLMWRWFLAPQYGEGPSLRAWFGIAVLHAMIFVISDVQLAKSEEPSKHAIRAVVAKMAIGLVLIGFTIVTAALARVFWGWR